MEPGEPLAAIYRLVTRQEPTARVRAAIDEFPGYAAGTIAARLLSVAAQIHVARHLEPADFGRFSLALAVALVLSVPVHDAWGAAFVKFAASHTSAEKPWHLLRVAMGLAVGSSVALLAFALLATPWITQMLDIPAGVYLVGVCTAAAATVWFLAKSTCQGLLAWRRLIFIELSWSVAVLVLPIGVRLTAGGFDWRIIAVFAAAYLLSGLAALPYWLTPAAKPARAERRRVWDFGKVMAGAAVVLPVLIVSDRFLVNAWAGLDAVGIYQAYALPSLGVAFFLAGLVNRFLFPFLNRGDPAAFRRLFWQSLPWAAAVSLPAISGATCLALLYLGYPIHPGVVALASLAALAFCVMSFCTFLVATNESRGPRIVLLTQLLAAAVFFPLTIGLLPVWPLGAPFAGYTVAFGVAAGFSLQRSAELNVALR
jgi:O-antigen/teichoic acid export membrane protein